MALGACIIFPGLSARRCLKVQLFVSRSSLRTAASNIVFSCNPSTTSAELARSGLCELKPSPMRARTPHIFKLSLTLRNTGSVARDHLASERTFIAHVHTIYSSGTAIPCLGEHEHKQL